MGLNKLAGLGIASIVLFGSVGQLAVNAQSVQALEARQGITDKAELLNVNFKHRGRHGVRRNFSRHGRRSLRNNFRRNNFRHNGRRSLRNNFKPGFGVKRHSSRDRNQHLEFDKAFSTGNNFDERIIRVRLF